MRREATACRRGGGVLGPPPPGRCSRRTQPGGGARQLLAAGLGSRPLSNCASRRLAASLSQGGRAPPRRIPTVAITRGMVAVSHGMGAGPAVTRLLLGLRSGSLWQFRSVDSSLQVGMIRGGWILLEWDSEWMVNLCSVTLFTDQHTIDFILQTGIMKLDSASGVQIFIQIRHLRHVHSTAIRTIKVH